jgi:hypothetical protein
MAAKYSSGVQLCSCLPSRLSAVRVAFDGASHTFMVTAILAVAQNLHCHTGVDVKRYEQRGAGTTGGVNGDLPHARLPAAALEIVVKVAWLDGGSVAGGEDQA